jgi:protein LTV1
VEFSLIFFPLNPLQFEKEYASDGSLDEEELENASNISADSEPPLLNAREDFDVLMDEFLQLELVGNKLAPSLEGDTPTDKLDALRKALVVDDDVAKRQALLDRAYVDDTRIPMPVDIDAEKERWDCETILSETFGRGNHIIALWCQTDPDDFTALATYSNLENHPRFLRLKQKPPMKRIVLDRKTGLPAIVENATPTPDLQGHEADSEEDGDRRELPESFPDLVLSILLAIRVTVTRPKGESKEEKKSRKKAVKEERQQRRTEKKGNKDAFALERKNIGRVMTTREKAGIRKL